MKGRLRDNTSIIDYLEQSLEIRHLSLCRAAEGKEIWHIMARGEHELGGN